MSELNLKENIRLLIWDMDDTFWTGTLSEGNISFIEENINIVRILTKRGIVNSISSKNNFNDVKSKLEEVNIWDKFVFSKINWEGKGAQIKKTIEDMNLRPESVLFIDDNEHNLEEVKYYVSNINVAGPEILSEILESDYFKGKDDSQEQRLHQYKVLEKKSLDAENYDDNVKFLEQSDIVIQILDNCLDEVERIQELIDRTNQLNYTKKRISQDELVVLLHSDDYENYYVKAKDKYGDYGIVGFISLHKGKKFEHFLFSCRSIGLGIENYLYKRLGYPKIDIVCPVSTPLDRTDVFWIREGEIINSKDHISKECDVLFLGGCDLKQTAFYLKVNNISMNEKYNYVSDKYIIHPEASELVRISLERNQMEKESLIDRFPFLDIDCFNNGLLDQQYKIVIYSPLIDYSIGYYKYKDYYIPYGSLEKKEITDIDLKFINALPSERFVYNLELIYNKIAKYKGVLILLNGSEVNVRIKSEKNRYLLHQKMNRLIDEFVNSHDNVYLIDVRNIITESMHTDNIRHYTREGYFNIALAIMDKFKLLDMDVLQINEEKESLSLRIRMKTLLRKIGILDFAYVLYKFIAKSKKH